MILITPRLVLRPWTDADAESLYECARDPEVGPRAGWPPHESAEESLYVIHNVLAGPEDYAICERINDRAIGAVSLKFGEDTNMTAREDECELGYWVGRPFWGRGYAPEAAAELMRHGFEDLGMTAIWCGCYEGNHQSMRVQEKLGFVYHHFCSEVSVPLLNETRKEYVNRMTRAEWTERAQSCNFQRKGGIELERLPYELSVCKIHSPTDIRQEDDFYFIGRTKEELSLVCKTESVPADAIAREDGWRAFRIQGELDFSLIGILSKLTGILAENQIGIFAISTYNTDYILVKKENFDRALNVLGQAGYRIA